ncbi:hypothetical protein [Streptomyces sp. 8L]|nr:hypothetical protein [Streptomyces sp. 8L]
MTHGSDGHCNCCTAGHRYKRYRWLLPVAVAIFKVAWWLHRS